MYTSTKPCRCGGTIVTEVTERETNAHCTGKKCKVGWHYSNQSKTISPCIDSRFKSPDEKSIHAVIEVDRDHDENKDHDENRDHDEKLDDPEEIEDHERGED
jgi:hypothetical protein